MEITETNQRSAVFDLLKSHLKDARELAVSVGLGEHFVSDVDHLMAVVKANREES